MGTSEACSVGMGWMRNLNLHPMSPQTQILGEMIRRYAKNTIRRNSFFFFPPFVFTNFTLTVDITILNPIGSYKVNFNGTIFVLRPIFYLKTPLMINQPYK